MGAGRKGEGTAGRELRGVKEGSNGREPRREGAREHRLIDSGGLARLCSQRGSSGTRARALVSMNTCQRLRKQND